MVEFKIEGLAALQRKLEALPKELVSRGGGAANPVAQSLRAAGKPMQKTAQGLAARAKGPYKVWTRGRVFSVTPGRLRESIKLVRMRRPLKGMNETFVLKPLGRDIRKKYGIGVNYWHLIEFGAPGRGIGARPFIRPAMDAHKTNFGLAFGRELGKRIERIARRMKARG